MCTGSLQHTYHDRHTISINTKCRGGRARVAQRRQYVRHDRTRVSALLQRVCDRRWTWDRNLRFRSAAAGATVVVAAAAASCQLLHLLLLLLLKEAQKSLDRCRAAAAAAAAAPEVASVSVRGCDMSARVSAGQVQVCACRRAAAVCGKAKRTIFDERYPAARSRTDHPRVAGDKRRGARPRHHRDRIGPPCLSCRNSVAALQTPPVCPAPHLH